MLNIFLDSNIFYGDPYLSQGLNRILLSKINKFEGKIYISDIVVKEVKNNYSKHLQEINNKIKRLNKELKGIPNSYDISMVEIQEELEKMQEHFLNSVNENKIVILETNNDLLPEVINRSINRIKPFTENKQEFRDCLIWLTYVNEVETNKLENCFFITNNISDFCIKDKNKKIHLHSDLKKDTNRIKIHSSIYKFLENEKKLIEKLDDINIECKIQHITINEFESQIEDIIMEEIYIEIDKYIADISSSSLSNIYKVNIDYASLTSIESYKIIEVKTDIDIQNGIVNYYGKLSIVANMDLQQDIPEEVYTLMNTKVSLEMNYSMIKFLKKNTNYTVKSSEDKYLIDDLYYDISVENIRMVKYDKDDIEEFLLDKYYEDIEYAELEMMETLMERNFH
ncbi:MULTISPECIES: PIN domain-containing protein [Clostridium]|uniref:DUF4935 domain-containing protein n=1 Tax=Clostridium novyi B str. ATCC 27606 TaxID=1443123 RepID=A0AA40IRN1_CLONO|nr:MULTISPECIES: PIN domain-containing protein [Clostridium]KEI08151.1 hypothetical protein Z958_p0031 [Clostridium novyi B str. NCTC 9691]KEI11490.1 hypothetical protein Z959_p0056 [Clostridium novyi B str. ATCC 27606]KLU74259.1 hypothetical protein CBC3_p0260 [Clostridium botulinum V891]MCD3202873.1 DUF4935 domain-containing protein [Clostridium botulinum C/D]MCD3230840.1 DUF4935 domain-containing protein [Clostridium botulinum C/D]